MSLPLLGKPRQVSILSATNVGFIVDASVSEEHAITVQTTEHPVERGFAITDHRRVQPSVIKLSGIVSNYPVALFASAGGATDYVTFAWGAFNTLKESGELVRIFTTLQIYENMMITDVSVPRNAQKGNSLEFTVTAKELRIVDSEEFPAPTIESAPADQPKPAAKNLGVKTPTVPSPAVLKSAAAGIADGALSNIAGSIKSLLPF